MSSFLAAPLFLQAASNHSGLALQPILPSDPSQCLTETIDGKVGVAQELLQIYGNISTPYLNGPPGTQNGEINPYALYGCEPAPMGIADFGVGSKGAYSYTTSSFLGTLNFNQFLSTADTIQQNVILNFTANGQDYYYWVQNVAQISPPEAYVATGPCATVCPPQNNTDPTTVNAISYETNIWNFSCSCIDMNPAYVSGANGSVSDNEVYLSSAGNNEAGNNVQLIFPSTVYLRVNTFLNSNGQPVVTFQYNDGAGGWQTYDTVTFLYHATSTPKYVVDGHKYNPYGIFFDAEVVFAGAGDSAASADTISNVQVQLQYYNGHNYQTIPDAYNFGSDTAETIANVEADAGIQLNNGLVYSELTGGPGVLGSLWNSSELATVTIHSPVSSGTVVISNSNSYQNATQVPFSGKRATVTIFPGIYDFSVFNAKGHLVGTATLDLYPGKTYSATA